MQRLFSYHQGNRSEYLAQYILSAFAICVPVPRQEDVGSDFLCSLLRREGNNLRPYSPFNIQIKSYSRDLIREGIPFGGITQGGNWRRHEIEQLCQTDTPFLVGVVNKDEQWLDIFSTVTRYFVRCDWFGSGWPRQVNVVPYEPGRDNDIGCGTIEQLEERPDMPRTLWKLPLGQPILRITIDDSEDPDRCEQIKRLLEPHLAIDQDNAILSRIGLGYFNWPLRIHTGQPLAQGAVALRSRNFNIQEAQDQLRTIARIVASLLKSYQLTNMKREILAWEPILDQLPIAPDPVLSQCVREALEFAHT
jgi:hypothetical protein